MATMEQILNNITQLMTAQAQQAQQNHQENQQLMTQLGQAITSIASKPKTLVDTRALGKPKEFSGKQNDWQEWRLKATCYLRASFADTTVDTDKWLRWAEQESDPIAPATVRAACQAFGIGGADVDAVLKFDIDMHYLCTVQWMTGEAILHMNGAESGLDAWRLVNMRYAPRTAGTKRNILIKALSLRPAKGHA